MTAAAPVPARPALAQPGPAGPAAEGVREKVPWVDAPRSQQAVSVALTMLCGILLTLLVNLTSVSQLQHVASQHHLYDQLRLSLAQGSTPVAPITKSGKVVPLGTPVAVMTAPEIGLAHEVVVEGSGSAQTMAGIGHRRDTVLPCQVGSSVLMARSAGYGGVGAAWSRLQNGDRFTVTMGQGSCTYQVVGERTAGDHAPQPPTGRGGALTLVTATGYPYAPTGVLRIDTALVSDSFDAPGVVFPAGSLPAAEEPMGVDYTQTLPLLIFGEILVGLAIGAVWLWRTWGRAPAFIVITPLALAALFLTARYIDLMLPNLI